ncbi:MAG TPA: helix-turn-helix domain-containing protein [Spirochaetia bacterium]|nr:helix-turn-helix domain-containing protein [Spirochaetia bacterium]
MDTHAKNMEIRVMVPHEGFRSGHFHEDEHYETHRPAGGNEWLLIVSTGGAGFYRRGGELERLGRGSALLYAPGLPQHYGTHPSDRSWELVWSHFPGTMRVHDLLRFPGLPGEPGILELGEAFDAAAAAMHELVAWHISGSPHRHEFAANALERALLWCNTVNPHTPNSNMDPRVERALQIIAARLQAPLTVALVADELGVSASRLSHLFKQHAGTSFPDYVEGRRMERAEDLLRMTGRDIATIARSVGYEDPLYFSRRFKTRTGLSPRAWRSRATFTG